MEAWEQQKHRHPPACLSASGSQLVHYAGRTKGSQQMIVCSSPFRHILYFLSPCIELANGPSQCMGLNCNNQN